MIDWRYRFATEPLEDFYLELGLYRLNREKTGRRWLPTPTVEQMKSYIVNSREAVGDLNLRQGKKLSSLMPVTV